MKDFMEGLYHAFVAGRQLQELQQIPRQHSSAERTSAFRLRVQKVRRSRE
jgi:hypothetical protein